MKLEQLAKFGKPLLVIGVGGTVLGFYLSAKAFIKYAEGLDDDAFQKYCQRDVLDIKEMRERGLL